jgi:hypothetical protein
VSITFFPEVEVKKDGMGRARGMHEKKLNAYRFLVGKPEGNTPLGRPRRNRRVIWTGQIWLRIGTTGGFL